MGHFWKENNNADAVDDDDDEEKKSWFWVQGACLVYLLCGTWCLGFMVMFALEVKTFWLKNNNNIESMLDFELNVKWVELLQGIWIMAVMWWQRSWRRYDEQHYSWSDIINNNNKANNMIVSRNEKVHLVTRLEEKENQFLFNFMTL